MTHKFKPGDKVEHLRQEGWTVLAYVEGWYKIQNPNGCEYTVRPSELTPADPGPDAATVLVRELCAAETLTLPRSARIMSGDFDEDPFALAFAKYIRANPPQGLTVERVRRASNAVLDYHMSIAEAEALIAALTEQRA